MVRRRHALTALAAVGLAPTLPARAQALVGTGRIVVGIPPGGPGDLLARSIAERMKPGYAATMLVDNRPGASTQLAITAVRNGPADGSMLLLTPSSPLSLFPYTYKQLPYNPDTDFAPVALLGSANHAFAVGPQVPVSVQTLKDYVAWAKANPRLANFGTAAAGSTPHLLGIALGHFGGASLTHVAYKGSSLGLQDLLGGNIGAMSSPVGFFLPHLASGKVRVLAVSGDQRSRFVPDVPTLKEQGIPVTAREWYGILAPSATPAHILKAAESTIQRALADGSIAETMAKAGFEIQAGNAATLGQMLRADIQEWAGITRQIGFSAES